MCYFRSRRDVEEAVPEEQVWYDGRNAEARMRVKINSARRVVLLAVAGLLIWAGVWAWRNLSDPLRTPARRQWKQQAIAQIYVKRGVIVPWHSHETEQMTSVLQGALRFLVGDEEVTVREGEVLHIPPGIAHQAEALDDTFVLDVRSVNAGEGEDAEGTESTRRDTEN